MLSVIPGRHEIVPERGTARRLDDSPADLRNPHHYPCVAVCLTCGRPIRCDTYLLSDWRHTDETV
jgi:hypothetical protein